MSRSVKQPSVREIVEAARVLGLDPEEVSGKALSGMPWEKTGYVVVKKVGSKIGTLKAVTTEVVKGRAKAAVVGDVKREKR